MTRRPQPLRPERVRTIERPFGWVPFRVLSSGLLLELDTPAKLLYFLLCLVADQYGVSFWGDRRLLEVLRLEPVELAQARADLVGLDLLAVDRQVSQLLSLPPSLPARFTSGSRRPKAARSRRGAEGLRSVGSIIGELFGEG